MCVGGGEGREVVREVVRVGSRAYMYNTISPAIYILEEHFFTGIKGSHGNNILCTFCGFN